MRASALALVFAAGLAWAGDPALVVRAAGSAKNLTLDEIRKLPARKVNVTPEHGPAADYECADLGVVLSASGVPMGKMRGKRLSEYLRAKAVDGYEVVFAVAELDPGFTDKLVLLCYLKAGAPLPKDEGPLRLVVPDEKRHARWMRQVTELSVEKAP